MVNWRSPQRLFLGPVVALLSFGLNSRAAQDKAEEVSAEALFADTPFDEWQSQGSHQEIKWNVRISTNGLSQHQRLEAEIEVSVPGGELAKRRADKQIVLLVRVTDAVGETFRNFSLLDLTILKPDVLKTDVVTSWEAFALPGDYDVAVALYDKATGEHNFQRRKLHIEPYKKDPLPEAWADLPSFEFWAPLKDGPDSLFRSDIDGRLRLPLQNKRPVQLKVLLDLTSSADIFRGNYAVYNRYLGFAVPVFKAFSQVAVANGSLDVAALDIVQRRILFEQDDAGNLDWPRLRDALAPANGPGVVSVQGLEQRHQSPVFLREELVRRLRAHSASPGEQAARPLRVFVLIGSPMDFYSFPALPPVEDAGEDCLVFYLQYQFAEHAFKERHGARFAERHWLGGAIGNVERMLRPLRVQTFKVYSAEDVRRALAKVLATISSM